MENFLKKPEKIFLAVCLFWGLIFLLVNPPFQGSDEDSHLYKIYGFTQGSLNFKKYSAFARAKISSANAEESKNEAKKQTFSGQILPAGLIEASRANKSITFHPERKTSFSQTAEISKIPLHKENRMFLAHPVTPYSPVSYVPAVFVIWFMTLFSASPFAMLVAGRLCSLFVYLVCGYFALKITPVKKWMFLAMLLMPMAVYESSVLSTDAFSTGMAVLLIAYSLRLAFDKKVEKITSKQNAVFLTLALFIGITKFVYLPLVFLYLLIPVEKFSCKKQRILSFFIIFCVTAFLSACYVGSHLFVTKDVVSFSTTISGADSLKFILTRPFEYIFMILKTLFTDAGYYLSSMTGAFGWSDTFLPLQTVVLYGFILVFTAVFDSSWCDSIDFGWQNKFIFAMCWLLCVFLVCTSCFIVFEPDMKNYFINGIQGRYFLPVAPVFLLLLSKGSGGSCGTGLNSKLVVLILMNLVLFVGLVRIIDRFYVK